MPPRSFRVLAAVVLGSALLAFAPTSAGASSEVHWAMSWDGTSSDRWVDTRVGAWPAVSAVSAHGGTGKGITVAPNYTASRGEWTKKTIGELQPYWSLSVWINFPTLPTAANLANRSANIVDALSDTSSGGTGNGHFQVFYRARDSRLCWDLLAANYGCSTMVIHPKTWYLVQAKGSYGTTTYTADVQINATAQRSIASAGMTPQNLGVVGIGTRGTNQSYTFYADSVLAAAGPAALPYLS